MIQETTNEADLEIFNIYLLQENYGEALEFGKKLVDNLKISVSNLVPYTKNFNSQIFKLTKKFHPQGIIIHITIKPSTTSSIQRKLQIPVIYSATRGVHKRMLSDLRKYTKFFAIENNARNKKWACMEFVKLLKKSGIKTKQMSSPITLE